MLDTAPATTPSYAPPARRRAYADAMRRRAAERRPGTPIRVYISVSPRIRQRPNWPQRLELISDALGGHAELLHYETAFPDGHDQYEATWHEVLTGMDGLLIVAARKKSGSRTLVLGPCAREELRAVVATGRPVLLHTYEHGLVPVVDCRPKRFGPDDRQRLRLTIPDDWDPNAETLQAALTALRPADTSHLDLPFIAPTLAAR